MNCEEFLMQFREALDGKVSEQLIQDNVNYYRSYINGQVASGKNIADVLSMLGDPRLLAKTIEESSKFASRGREDSRTGYTAQGSSERDYDREVNDRKHIHIPGWIIAGIVMMVMFLLLMVVFRVFVFFMPLIIILLAAGVVYKIIQDWISSQ